METLKLKVNKEILDEILEILNKFKSEDLQIIVEETEDVNKLHQRFNELNSKNAKFISLEELDAELEETISKYED